MSGKNPTNINFVSIGNQVMFLDTIKYFQQSLGTLASNLIKSEKIFLKNLMRSQKKDQE